MIMTTLFYDKAYAIAEGVKSVHEDFDTALQDLSIRAEEPGEYSGNYFCALTHVGYQYQYWEGFMLVEEDDGATFGYRQPKDNGFSVKIIDVKKDGVISERDISVPFECNAIDFAKRLNVFWSVLEKYGVRDIVKMATVDIPSRIAIDRGVMKILYYHYDEHHIIFIRLKDKRVRIL